jgi:VWFA-related protein
VAAALMVASVESFEQQAPPPAQQPPPVFRAATSLVPVDVRVTDRTGRPVTDLTQADFTVLENNVRQQIRHFSTLMLSPDLTVEPRPIVRTAAGEPLGAQTARIFLIVLGRGRLQPPAKGVDGMIHFVRERLLPQDRVAVLAWNRATDFTTDHEAIALMLERFRRSHERIEADLAMAFSGLAAIYGSNEIPKHLQTSIDEIFGGADRAPLRTVTDAPIANSGRLADDQRRIIDKLQRDEIVKNALPGTVLPEVETVEALGRDISLDEMASINAQSMQDLGKIYTGIRYLRYLDGEKHLLFVSPSGIFLPRAEDDRSLAAIAADARVAIDIIHTGGSSGMAFDWRGMTSRNVAEETGGEYSSLSYAKDFVDRLDKATRSAYVLGYYPANPALDGRYRHITVRVNRPGLVVSYRHGYFARTQLAPLDRQKIVSYSRVTAAASFSKEVRDIALTATAVNATADNKTREVQVEVKIAPDRLSFVDKGGRKAGAIEVAIFCADGQERLIGQSWNTAQLEMTPDAFARFQAQGLTYREKVSVRAQAKYVKVVVYDVGSDVVGTAIVKLK